MVDGTQTENAGSHSSSSKDDTKKDEDTARFTHSLFLFHYRELQEHSILALDRKAFVFTSGFLKKEIPLL